MTIFEKTKHNLEEVIKELEADWDFPSIRYETVMNLKEWNNFSKHPERQPYKSPLKLPKTLEGKYEFGLQLVKKSLSEYEKEKKHENKETLRGLIATLLNTTLHIKYQIDEIRLSDAYVGRKDEDRDNGNIKPSQLSLTRLDYAIKEYSRFSNKDYTTLSKKIDKITKGIPSLLTEYYSTCDIDDDFRDDIKYILQIWGRDKTQEYTDLQRAFEIWKALIKSGITLDKYLELNGFPKFSIVKGLLISYLKKENDVKELEKHLADEFPITYKKYKKEGQMNRYSLLKEEARIKKYPKRLKTNSEIDTMVKKSMEEVYQYLKLAKRSNPKYQIINVMSPFGTRRAFQSAVKNRNDETVSTIVMTPRADDPTDYLSTFAHESTHALHKIVLDLGEKSGVLNKNASQTVTQPVMEAFSTLVDDLFGDEKYLPYKKKYTKGNFPNFRSLYSLKFQAWFGLTQLSFVNEIEKLIIEKKYQYLPDTTMVKISETINKGLSEWMNTGFKVDKGLLQALDLLSSFSPDDGLRYIKTYITEKTTQKSESSKKQNISSEKHITMPEAFKRAYGKFWLSDKDARIVLHWLLLETGRNLDVDSYPKYILNANIKLYSDELKKIGIDIDNI